MAAHASCRRQVVVVIDVAIAALSRRYRMRAGQSEPCAGMIKRRIEPRSGVVALLAGLGEVRRDVVGIGRALIILQVTRYASRGGDVVIVVDVAVSALSRRH